MRSAVRSLNGVSGSVFGTALAGNRLALTPVEVPRLESRSKSERMVVPRTGQNLNAVAAFAAKRGSPLRGAMRTLEGIRPEQQSMGKTCH